MLRQEKNQETEKSTEKNHSYWGKELINPPRLHLTGNTQEKNTLKSKSERYQTTLDTTILNEIHTLCKTHGYMPKHVLLSALYVTLLHYNQGSDIILGTTHYDATKDNLLSILPLRTHFTSDELHTCTFLALAQHYRDTEQNALLHALPLGDIFRSLPLAKRALFNQNTPFQILLEAEQPNTASTASDDAVQFEYFGIQIKGDSCVIQFNSQLFDKQFIDRFFKHFYHILCTGITNQETMLTAFPRLLETEKNDITSYNDTKQETSQRDTLLSHFEKIAAANASKPFVYFHTELPKQSLLTYEQVNQEANQLAHYLLSLNLPTNTYMGLAIERSLHVVPLFLGLFKAGIPFIPLDTNHPGSLKHRVADKNMPYILTDNANIAKLTHTTQTILNLDDPAIQKSLSEQKTTNITVTLDNTKTPVYKIYTSGSTGAPKAIIIPREGLNNLHSALMKQPFPNNAQIINTASICFDAWYFDVILAIAKTGSIHLTPDTKRHAAYFVSKIIQNNRINVGVFVPHLFAKLNYRSSLTHVILMGDVPNLDIIKKFMRASKNGMLFNGYGPTENSIASSLGEYKEGQLVQCIGKGLQNNQLFCVDPETRQIVSPDVEGEIWLSGPGLALEYDANPELTNAQFVTYYLNKKTFTFDTTPSSDAPDAIRIYKTGDYGCFCINKNHFDIKFIGRQDKQKKLNGARIDLDNVQQLIATHPYIKEVTIQLALDEKSLVAFLVLHEGITQDNLYDIMINHLRNTPLPMVAFPSKLIVLDAMPFNTNGKIDQEQLKDRQKQEQQHEPCITRDYTTFEQQLLPLYLTALSLTKEEFNQADLKKTFKELGGDSLSWLNLIQNISDKKAQFELESTLTAEKLTSSITPFSSLETLAALLAKYSVNENQAGAKPSLSTQSMFSNETKIQNSTKINAEKVSTVPGNSL